MGRTKPVKPSCWSKICCLKSQSESNILDNSYIPTVTSLDSLQMVLHQQGHMVVVKIFAEWAKPCQKVKKEFAILAKENSAVLFYKVDVDKCQGVAESMHVDNLPTFIVFHCGRELCRSTDLDQVRRAIKKLDTKKCIRAMKFGDVSLYPDHDPEKPLSKRTSIDFYAKTKMPPILQKYAVVINEDE